LGAPRGRVIQHRAKRISFLSAFFLSSVS